MLHDPVHSHLADHDGDWLSGPCRRDRFVQALRRGTLVTSGTAAKFYTEAIDTGRLSGGDLAMVLTSRGVAYDMMGETDRAIEDFDSAIRLTQPFRNIQTPRPGMGKKTRLQACDR
jgi:hypothetical protein